MVATGNEYARDRRDTEGAERRQILRLRPGNRPADRSPLAMQGQRLGGQCRRKGGCAPPIGRPTAIRSLTAQQQRDPPRSRVSARHGTGPTDRHLQSRGSSAVSRMPARTGRDRRRRTSPRRRQGPRAFRPCTIHARTDDRGCGPIVPRAADDRRREAPPDRNRAPGRCRH